VGATRGGYLLVLVAAACFGTLGVFSKLFYDAGGEAWTLLFLRFAVTGPVLVVLALALRERPPNRRVALLGASLGIFQIGVAYALFEGFERAPVALVTLLYFAYPLITAVGASLLYKEELGPRRAVILAVALAGVALTIGIPDSANWVGIVLGLVAGLCVSVLILSSRYLMVARGLSPIALSALMFTSPAILLALLIPARAPSFDLSGEAWGWAAAAVFVAAAIPITLFYSGVRRAGATAAGLLSTVEPVVSVLLAYAVLGESLSALQFIGGTLIIISVIALSLEGSRSGSSRPRV
jgi:drug/metabolite transporter (DMT)-like permease